VPQSKIKRLLQLEQFGSIMTGRSLSGTDNMGRNIIVQAMWDPEVSVWVATSEEIHLVTEAPSMDALMEKLPGLIQDLVEDIDDGDEVKFEELSFEVIAHIRESVRVRRAA
jgi:hypothetical protein